MVVDEGFMVKKGEAIDAEKLATDGWRGGLIGREGCQRGAHSKGEKRGNSRSGELTGKEHCWREMESERRRDGREREPPLKAAKHSDG